jgi:hypothetical protein
VKKYGPNDGPLDLRSAQWTSIKSNAYYNNARYSSIERVEEFKYLRMRLTDQNSIQKEIKSRLKLGNACYHSVQNVVFQVAIQKLKDQDI